MGRRKPCKWCLWLAENETLATGGEEMKKFYALGRVENGDMFAVARGHGNAQERLKSRMEGALEIYRKDGDMFERAPHDSPHYWVRLKKKFYRR